MLFIAVCFVLVSIQLFCSGGPPRRPATIPATNDFCCSPTITQCSGAIGYYSSWGATTFNSSKRKHLIIIRYCFVAYSTCHEGVPRAPSPWRPRVTSMPLSPLQVMPRLLKARDPDLLDPSSLLQPLTPPSIWALALPRGNALARARLPLHRPQPGNIIGTEVVVRR